MDTLDSFVSLDMACQAPIEMPPTSTTQVLQTLIRPELRSTDMSVSTIVGTLGDDITFDASGPAAFSITLVVEGSGYTLLDGCERLDVTSGKAIFFWSDGLISGRDHIRGGNPIETVEIRFHPDYLSRTVGSMTDAIRNAFAVDRSDPGRNAFLLAIPLSAELLDVARSILGCAIQEKKLREIFMRGKALEVLAVTLELLSRTSPAATRLSSREREKLEEARRLIELSFAEPWTIGRLAGAVGLSETKLKLGFREVIGRPVRAYLRDVRMDNAERMLGDGRSVTEAALECGYGNLSHFSKAFLRRKGVAPHSLTLQRRRG
ncbi:AraC family transcriptional regulator [Hyphomicrobium nitrativorans NL23]|uniref:AraC family transcriptional regulator n=2 Tax=Hyphomicrobium TaxID=81 RepID=V5SGQ6_9HYPH|nr:AraC family transcriptional regulator [Hyphomicrobium nitrativorans NL23]